MRTNLQIAASFLTVIVFNLIPRRTKLGDIIITYRGGSLPSLFACLIICGILLLAIVLLMRYKYTQPLQGQSVLKRKDFNITKQLGGIPYWFGFVLTSAFVVQEYLYFLYGTTSYFLIILSSFIAYLFFAKWVVKKYYPDFLSIAGDTLYFKSIWGNGNRKLVNLESVGYNTSQNAITLNFQEGLDNIKLYLTDYEITDILNFISCIQAANSNAIQFEENFKKHFSVNM